MTTDAGEAASGERGARAAWMLALRSGVSQSWRAGIALAALFGVSAGIAVAALTMADRVESSYDTLIAETDAPDAMAGCSDCDLDDEAEFAANLRADPAIRHVGVLLEVHPILYTADGVLLGPFTDECETGAGEMSVAPATWAPSDTSPVRLTSGRLPKPGAADEIALPVITAERAGVKVGDKLFATGVCHDREGDAFQPQTLTVVGIFVGFVDVRPPGQADYFELAIGDPGFGSTIGIAPQPGVTFLWYADGAAFDDLGEAARSSIRIDMKDHARLIGDRLRPDATALRILAALGALAAVAVLGQLLARHLRLLGADHATLRALGTTRRGLWCLGIGHASLIGVAAAVIAATVALASFPFVPPGSAEGILLGTGSSIPLSTLALGAAITISVIVLLAVVPSWLAARTYARAHTPGRQSLAPRIVGGGRLGTAPSWGVRLALEPAGGPQPVPVRSGLGAAVIATAVVAGVITFAAGLEHLRATPRLVGWDWDFAAGGDDVDVAALAEFAAAHPDVARSSAGTIFPSNISLGTSIGFEVYEIAFGTGPHAITPVVVTGAAPQGADEIVINAQLADRLGFSVGDEVAVYSQDSFAFLHQMFGVETDLSERRETSFELVGICVVPMLDGRLDRGVALTLDGLQRIFTPPSHDELIALLLSAEPTRLYEALIEGEQEELAAQIEAALPDDTAAVIVAWTDEQLAHLSRSIEPQAVFVQIAEGADRAALANDFIESGLINEQSLMIGMLPDGTLATTKELVPVDLDDVAWIPSGMGILMGLTTLAVLAHLIATGARARRRDIATLRALGLVGRQARAIIAWQALTLVVVTVAIALPVGVVAGRYAWSTYAEGLGVVPEPVTPWAALAVLFAGLVVAHLLASLIPGRSAARMRPVDSLRSE